MNSSFLIFLSFLKRDFYVYLKQIKNYLINYGIIYPTLFSISYGYIIPNTLFNTSNLPSLGIILTGSLAFVFVVLPATLNLLLLIDLENDRYVDYQLIVLNPKLIIFQKIVFSTIFSCCVILLFLFSSKIILRESLDTSLLSVPKLLIILIIGCFACSAYAICAACVLKGTSQIGTWWRRVNSPMLILGGNWVPWIATYKVSKYLAYLTLINPIVYITEGIRGSIFGQSIYIPFFYCVITLIAFSIIFTLLAQYFFKKRTDYVS